MNGFMEFLGLCFVVGIPAPSLRSGTSAVFVYFVPFVCFVA